MITRRVLVATGALAPLAGRTWAADGPLSAYDLMPSDEVKSVAVSPDGEMIAVGRVLPVFDKSGTAIQTRYDSEIHLHSARNIAIKKVVKLNGARLVRLWWPHKDMVLANAVPDGMAGAKLLRVSRSGQSPSLVLRDNGLSYNLRVDEESPVALRSPDGETLLVRATSTKTVQYGLYSLNIATGLLREIDTPPQKTSVWAWGMDGVTPVLRVDKGDGKTYSLLERAKGSGKWSEVKKLDSALFKDTGDPEPGPDPQTFCVRRLIDGQVYGYQDIDVKAGAWLAGPRTRSGLDSIHRLADGQGRTRAVGYLNDVMEYDTDDEKLRADLKVLTGAFPGASVRIVSTSDDLGFMAAQVSGPTQPPLLVSYDRAKGAIGVLDQTLPGVSPKRLSRAKAINVTTRDGWTLRAYVTGETGPDRPLVVWPASRLQAQFSEVYAWGSQALAQQGWAVLQVNCRGSSGFGKTFLEASRRQWNGAVLADLEDAIDKVTAAGLADPRKVVLFGEQIGGYTALTAAIRRPDAYRAVAVVEPPIDLQSVRESAIYLAGDDLIVLAGDKVARGLADEVSPDGKSGPLRAASLVFRTAEIKTPVLYIDRDSDPDRFVKQMVKKPGFEHYAITDFTLAPSEVSEKVYEKVFTFFRAQLT